MRRTPPVLTTLTLGAAIMLGACAITPSNPYPPVPPLQAEVMPLPPVTATPLIWQPGHWDWTGSGYSWVPGAFVPRGDHSDQWMPAYWALIGGTWTWQPAHWQ